jgi:hypothetical protein
MYGDSLTERWEEFLLRSEMINTQEDSLDTLYNDITNVAPLAGEVFVNRNYLLAITMLTVSDLIRCCSTHDFVNSS